jgi:predicted ester cyclase
MKKLLIILPMPLILCFMVSCQDKTAMAELQEFRTQAALEEQNKAIFRHFTEELNKGNTKVFSEFCAPNYAYYFPSNTQRPLSLEKVEEAIKTTLISFPDYKWTIEELFAVRDRVIARISSSGTFTEDYSGIPPTGNKIGSSAIFIVRIENGKIVEQRKEEDTLNIWWKLGFELKPIEKK